MPTIGPGSFILIVVVALLIFGPFKNATKGLADDDSDNKKKEDQ